MAIAMAMVWLVGALMSPLVVVVILARELFRRIRFKNGNRKDKNITSNIETKGEVN